MFELLGRIELSSFLFVTTVILLVVVFAFIIIFFITYNRNLSIQRAMKSMQEKHQEHNLTTLENERQRFAQDLHDEIGASLSAIRLYVSDIYSGNNDDEVKAKLQQVKQTIDQSMASTRRISHNILPPGLEHMGLSHVVRDLVHKFNISDSIHVTIEAQPNIPKLDYNRELILYRVLQELLNNTIKHAQASAINIVFSFTELNYCISYSDNGIGFGLDEVKEEGIGLKNVKSRVAMVGGYYEINTSAQNGFAVTVVVPIQEESTPI
jgi:two-component system NarL family sensor kinase